MKRRQDILDAERARGGKSISDMPHFPQNTSTERENRPSTRNELTTKGAKGRCCRKGCRGKGALVMGEGMVEGGMQKNLLSETILSARVEIPGKNHTCNKSN